MFLCFLLVLLLFAVISELIHYTAAGTYSDVLVHMPLIQVIVPQVMSLKAQLRDSSKVLHLIVFKVFLFRSLLKSLIEYKGVYTVMWRFFLLIVCYNYVAAMSSWGRLKFF